MKAIELFQRSLTTFATGVLLLGVACVGVGYKYHPSVRTHSALLISGIFIGIALASSSVILQPRLERILANRSLYYASIGCLAIIIPLVIYWCGMTQFGGFDHSMVIDSGWRLFNGQHPFSNFPCTAPISFFLIPYYAFMIFGVYWYSLVIVFAIFSSVTFLWSFALLTQLFESHWYRLVFAVALQALCMIPVSYWWYNPVTAASGIIFALSAYVWLRRPKLAAAAWSYFFSLLLLATMKPNVAGCLILPIFAILLTSREHRVRVLILSGLAFAVFVLGLQFHGINFIECVRGYLSVSKRGFVIGQFFTDASRFEVRLSVLALVLVMLPFAGCLFWKRALVRQWRFAGVGSFCAAAGLNSFLCAGETKVGSVAQFVGKKDRENGMS